MRSDIGTDQAEGLRRLLVRARHGEMKPPGTGVPASHLLAQSAGYAITSDLASLVGSPGRMASSFISDVSEVHNRPKVIALVSGKPGVRCASTAVNLAAALACIGKDVLVLDENHAPDNPLDRFGLYAKHDLLDAAQGKCLPDDAVLTTRGVSVLRTARAMHEFPKLDRTGQQRLKDALAEVSCGMDVMLVDAAMPVLSQVEVPAGQAAVSSSLASGGALVVVADATVSGITESYALIKRLVLENACLRFWIVVNKVTDERAAMTVFGNMARVARHNLAAQLEYLGYIHNDDRLRRATQLGRSVVEAFPSAVSAKHYMDLAQRLLRLPMWQDEAEGGITHIIQNPTRQSARQHSREMAHVVD